MTPCRRAVFLFLTSIAAIVVSIPWCPADYVFLKDGTILRGRVQIEGEILRDASGQQFWIRKLGGFYLVNDGVRRMVFSKHNVLEARDNPAEYKRSVETFEFRPPLKRTTFARGLRSVKVEEVGAWDSRGYRTITLFNERTGTTKQFVQCLTKLSPHSAEVGAQRVRWNSRYLTDELPRQTVLRIIRHHLRTKKPPATKTEERLSVFRFCVQAGWYAEAEAELTDYLREDPGGRERIQSQIDLLHRLQAQEQLDAIETAVRAGQYVQAKKLIADFPKQGVPDRLSTAVSLHRRKIAKDEERLRQLRRLLPSVLATVKRERGSVILQQAAEEILEQLNRDTGRRLEPFLTLALQEERNRANGFGLGLPAEELLALAVTGWVLGDKGAQSRVGVAEQLWQARRFAVDYLRTDEFGRRRQLLASYLATEAVSTDVMAQILRLLPPVQPEPLAGQTWLTLRVASAERGSRLPYRVQVPPEYHHYRPYPVLIVLPNVQQSADEVREQWGTWAARHGYLLAVPEWARLLQHRYRYAAEERDSIVSVIRDLRRRFNVDSSRVFLAGFDESGTMAYDVSLSRPDLFAGVVIMCAEPMKQYRRYRANAQYLPFYVIEGERSPNNAGQNRRLFEYWMTRGFPALYVEYLGRGLEFFAAELPFVFEWMRHQERADGLPYLGGRDLDGGPTTDSFRSFRRGESRFYWITSDRVTPSASGAWIRARVARADRILIRMSGYKQLSVWLNSAMVDFDQELEIRINPGHGVTSRTFRGRVEPRLSVLLEDFYARGDRRNLYVARIDFTWK